MFRRSEFIVLVLVVSGAALAVQAAPGLTVADLHALTSREGFRQHRSPAYHLTQKDELHAGRSLHRHQHRVAAHQEAHGHARLGELVAGAGHHEDEERNDTQTAPVPVSRPRRGTQQVARRQVVRQPREDTVSTTVEDDYNVEKGKIRCRGGVFGTYSNTFATGVCCSDCWWISDQTIRRYRCTPFFIFGIKFSDNCDGMWYTTQKPPPRPGETFYVQEVYTTPPPPLHVRACTGVFCNQAAGGGECYGGACYCSLGFQGLNCSEPACENNCNGAGTCVAPGVCNCTGKRFTGLYCDLDECVNQRRCGSKGRCREDGSCECEKMWKGEQCTEMKCNARCEHGKSCKFIERLKPEPFCHCGLFFQGDTCNKPKCFVKQCHEDKGQGKCMPKNDSRGVWSADCKCSAGWSGLECQTGACGSSNRGSVECKNGGTCKENGKCNCTLGFGGNLCETPTCDHLSFCTDILGHPRGECVLKTVKGNVTKVCECFEGFSGANCSENQCPQRFCKNGGKCVGWKTCKCSSQWKGDDCSQPHCGTCEHDGECKVVEPFSYPRCVCRGPWTGAHCNVSACFGWPCQHGGSCTGPNTCECQPSWRGAHCEIPECKNCTNGICRTFQHSDTTTIIAKCVCQDGWKMADSKLNSGNALDLSSSDCDVDVNECEDRNETVCDGRPKRCTNLNGSFSCACEGGYRAILVHGQFQCSDVDECTQHHRYMNRECSHTRYITTICNNTLGSFEIECCQGYKMHYSSISKASTCRDIDGCCSKINPTAPCPDGMNRPTDDGKNLCNATNNEICVNLPPGETKQHECKCKLGFVKKGTKCESVKGCSLYDPCGYLANRVCNDSDDEGSVCQCEEGYSITNKNVRFDVCLPTCEAPRSTTCMDSFHLCDTSDNAVCVSVEKEKRQEEEKIFGGATCLPTYWGKDCTERCYCKDYLPCDSTTGKCFFKGDCLDNYNKDEDNVCREPVSCQESHQLYPSWGKRSSFTLPPCVMPCHCRDDKTWCGDDGQCPSVSGTGGPCAKEAGVLQYTSDGEGTATCAVLDVKESQCNNKADSCKCYRLLEGKGYCVHGTCVDFVSYQNAGIDCQKKCENQNELCTTRYCKRWEDACDELQNGISKYLCKNMTEKKVPRVTKVCYCQEGWFGKTCRYSVANELNAANTNSKVKSCTDRLSVDIPWMYNKMPCQDRCFTMRVAEGVQEVYDLGVVNMTNRYMCFKKKN